jgi:predicted DNA-binding transcriptional regulator AlpA
MTGNQNIPQVAENLSDKLLDLKTVSENLGIAVRTVWRGVQKGELPRPVKVGRCTRWFTSEIEAYKARLRSERDKDLLSAGHN